MFWTVRPNGRYTLSVIGWWALSAVKYIGLAVVLYKYLRYKYIGRPLQQILNWVLAKVWYT